MRTLSVLAYYFQWMVKYLFLIGRLYVFCRTDLSLVKKINWIWWNSELWNGRDRAREQHNISKKFYCCSCFYNKIPIDYHTEISKYISSQRWLMTLHKVHSPRHKTDSIKFYTRRKNDKKTFRIWNIFDHPSCLSLPRTDIYICTGVLISP